MNTSTALILASTLKTRHFKLWPFFTGIKETLFFSTLFFTHTVKWKYSPQQKVSRSKQHVQDDKAPPPTGGGGNGDCNEAVYRNVKTETITRRVGMRQMCLDCNTSTIG
jgi:hypothetical protein